MTDTTYPPGLLIVHDPTCPYSRAFIPVFVTAMSDLRRRGRETNVVFVDRKRHLDQAMALTKTVPKLFAVKEDGSRVEYSGRKTREAIEEFILSES